MAATEDGFELTSAEQHRLETAIQTVVYRRNGSLPVAIIADQANLSERVVREALDRAAAGGTRIVQVGGGYELKIDG